jgi:hypothetical protein
LILLKLEFLTYQTKQTMSQTNNLPTSPVHSASLSKRMLIGAAFALIPISLLLLSVDHPNPAWPKFWMIRPLIIVPLAGAVGGAFSYYMEQFRVQGGWKAAAAIVVSVLVYFIGLWLGIVLGLDGTLWN